MKGGRAVWAGPATALTWLALSVCAVTALALLSNRPVLALPEYAARTGETCAVCHVNPGGGGPRTLRGLLWAAQGRPDQVPSLPNQLIAPGVADGAELYSIACAGCHGSQGEGLYAIGLVGTGISKPTIRSYVRSGIRSIGMPAFDGQFTQAQLAELVAYVTGLADGSIPPPPRAYALPAPQFQCGPAGAEPAGDSPACLPGQARQPGGN